MIAPLAKFIDWSALQVMSMWRPLIAGRSARLDESLQFLKGPDFIPAVSEAARVEFYDPLQFRFPTPLPCEFAENNVVYGRLYRCAGRWQERPVIVLLHGGGGDPDYHFRFPLIARRCNRAGFNVATLVAPYYFRRRPRQPGTLSEPDYLRTAKTFAQAVAEIRALTGWLLEEGCSAVALWGSSYGGWLAGLAACRDARLAAVVMTVPGVRLNCLLAEQFVRRNIREALQERGAAWEQLNMTPLNLTLTRPKIPPENILLIEGVHDLFVRAEPVEELWQVWGRPDIWRLPHGHAIIGCGLLPGMTGRVLRWLAPRLEAGRKNNA
jgi:dienelactone hydrolase